MTSSVDRTIFEKKLTFLSIFLLVSLFGILLISVSAYHASRELEVIHDMDNMSHTISTLIGEKNIRQIIRSGKQAEQSREQIFVNTAYRFFIFSNNQLQPLHHDLKGDNYFLNSIDLESTRVNEHGGYYKVEGNFYTWVKFENSDSQNYLLVVHKFTHQGVSNLLHVYKKRMLVPIIFYLLLMVWLSLIFSNLLHKLRTQKDQMKHMALHDALTGLANRNLLDDRLRKLIQVSHRDKKQFAYSLIDIDGFKGINDKYGHVYGDELLCQVAKRLEGLLRESDTAARLGGDEFVVMLSGINEHTWHAAFERMLVLLTEPYTLFEITITIKISIGVSIYSEHGDDADTLMRNADQAMYTIKAEGGGIHVYEK